MNALADAVVYAFTYLGIAQVGDERAESDCDALESLTCYLSAITPAERAALAAALQRAIAAEEAMPEPRQLFLSGYQDFAETFLNEEDHPANSDAA